MSPPPQSRAAVPVPGGRPRRRPLHRPALQPHGRGPLNTLSWRPPRRPV